jgi:hypothetical protein
MRFKFYIVPEGESPCYQNDSVSLAEGLSSLGFEIYGNGKYWYNTTTEEYLIKEEYEGYKADIHVYNSYYFEKIDPNLTSVNAKNFNVLLDFSDGFRTMAAGAESFKFKLVLKAHYNKCIKWNENVIPWAFGIENRIVEENYKCESQVIQNKIFQNFRVFYNARHLARRGMDPILSQRFSIFNHVTDSFKDSSSKLLHEKSTKSYWWQTYYRHDPEYFQILNSSLLTYCFGGPIIPIWKAEQLYYLFGNKFLKISRQIPLIGEKIGVRKAKYYINYQFDSWRFWESMSSNSCPVHMNFEDWGFQLPVNPIEGVHYIGVDGLKFNECAEKILNMDDSEIKKIAQNGKEWSIKHYGALAVANRFLSLIRSYY